MTSEAGDEELGARDRERLIAGPERFAPGEAAEHRYGVLYQGEWETPWDGTATAVRLHARALATTGLPVLLKTISGVLISEQGAAVPAFAAGIPLAVREEVGALTMTSIGVLIPAIRHVVVRDAEHLRRLIVPLHLVHPDPTALIAMRATVYASTIIYSVWERDRVGQEIAAQLGRVGACWVPCEQNRQMLSACGVPAEQVAVVPHPYAPEDPILSLTARRPRPKRFYMIGRWEPRKAPHELVGAFLLAFRPEDAVTLTVKYTGGHWQHYPSAGQSVPLWLDQPSVRERGWTAETAAQHVTLIGDRLPRSRIIQLHFENSIYVSASHGEAWNLGAFDAKLAGNRLVHVPYGGTADFAEPSDLAVPYGLGPVHPSYGWEPDARWARYALTDLVEALRRATPPEQFERSPALTERFSLEAVGRRMRDLLLPVVEQTSRAAADYLRLRSGQTPGEE